MPFKKGHKINLGIKRKPFSEEHKSNISKGKKDENNPRWKGGSYKYWHDKVWELFGKDNCEKCNINNEESIIKYKNRLEMHNTLLPKDYTILKEEVWMTLCKSCHIKLEHKIKKEIN